MNLKELAQKIIKENSEELYRKVKALYDRPGTPGEKTAAKNAMDRIRAHLDSKKPTAKYDSSDYDKKEGHRKAHELYNGLLKRNPRAIHLNKTHEDAKGLYRYHNVDDRPSDKHGERIFADLVMAYHKNKKV
jgi:hypothetical protein